MKEILINNQEGKKQILLVEDGKLVEKYIEDDSVLCREEETHEHGKSKCLRQAIYIMSRAVRCGVVRPFVFLCRPLTWLDLGARQYVFAFPGKSFP